MISEKTARKIRDLSLQRLKQTDGSGRRFRETVPGTQYETIDALRGTR